MTPTNTGQVTRLTLLIRALRADYGCSCSLDFPARAQHSRTSRSIPTRDGLIQGGAPIENRNESTAERFVRYQASFASKLRYELTERNLEQLHDLGSQRRVLDAAAGNGLSAEFLLRRGHTVTLYDADPEMLRLARERLGAAGLLARCEFRVGSLESVGRLLAGESFDLALCHHALEYARSPRDILRDLRSLAAAAGEISLVTLNPVSETIRAAVFRRDAALAREKLDDTSYDARWFGQATLYSFEQVCAWAQEAGWRFADFRGLRVLADYIPEQQAAGQAEEVLALEAELAPREPYRRFGRYLQFCFRCGRG